MSRAPSSTESFVESLPPEDRERLASLLSRIVERLRPEEIWLFGSRAEGCARPESDYDLLAVLSDGASAEELDPIAAWVLTRGLRIAADIIPCTRSEFEEEKHEIDTLARAAFLRGKRIYVGFSTADMLLGEA